MKPKEIKELKNNFMYQLKAILENAQKLKKIFYDKFISAYEDSKLERLFGYNHIEHENLSLNIDIYRESEEPKIELSVAVSSEKKIKTNRIIINNHINNKMILILEKIPSIRCDDDVIRIYPMEIVLSSPEAYRIKTKYTYISYSNNSGLTDNFRKGMIENFIYNHIIKLQLAEKLNMKILEVIKSLEKEGKE